jgi:hypothetical protein
MKTIAYIEDSAFKAVLNEYWHKYLHEDQIEFIESPVSIDVKLREADALLVGAYIPWSLGWVGNALHEGKLGDVPMYLFDFSRDLTHEDYLDHDKEIAPLANIFYGRIFLWDVLDTYNNLQVRYSNPLPSGNVKSCIHEGRFYK